MYEAEADGKCPVRLQSSSLENSRLKVAYKYRKAFSLICFSALNGTHVSVVLSPWSKINSTMER